jgi:predicted phosphatase
MDSDDPKINRYDRKKLYYDIRTYINDIQCLKMYHNIKKGWFWNCWRQVIVVWRTEEADKFDAY